MEQFGKEECVFNMLFHNEEEDYMIYFQVWEVGEQYFAVMYNAKDQCNKQLLQFNDYDTVYEFMATALTGCKGYNLKSITLDTAKKWIKQG